MDTPHHHRRRKLTLLAAVTTLAFLFLAFFSFFSPSRLLIGVGARKMREEVAERVLVARRRLGGLGSSPPSCRSKCGRCAPCRAVHVPIHPGFSMKLEYYPEAWRCKCKDKIFMP